MNEVTIHDNNLPVFLQQYDIDSIDNKKGSVGKVPLLVRYNTFISRKNYEYTSS